MQIRLTVVDPLGSPPEPRGRAAACDVLVTAPAGTALAAVASGLASAVGGSDSQVVLYAGAERLDAQRCTLGEPPLTDGAVLSLGSPAEPGPDVDDGAAQLHVVAGPDAGGVHLLHGGQIHIGRSADADVPLDDPDVSRLHCAVTVTPEGRVSVADLGSTNGTTLDGTRVGTRPVRLAPGALLRVGETALRLTPPGATGALGTTPDGEGHVRVTAGAGPGTGTRGDGGPARPGPASPAATVPHARVGGAARTPAAGKPGGTAVPPPAGDTHHAYGSAEWGAAGGVPGGAQERGPADPRTAPSGRPSPAPSVVPEQGGAPRIETRPRDGAGPDATSAPARHGEPPAGTADDASAPGTGGTRKGTPQRGTDVPPGVRRRGGIGAWARRLTGGRGGPTGAGQDPYDDEEAAAEDPLPHGDPVPGELARPRDTAAHRAGAGTSAVGARPRSPGGADRAAGHGRPGGARRFGPAARGAGHRGAARGRRAGPGRPRPRLAGLARAVVAQLAALHSPDALEIVLISTDRSRTVQERTAEWSWLGWLPHVRPTHGQDCRLLLAYDREQATARTDELLRRLEDHLTETGGTAGGPAPLNAFGVGGTQARDDRQGTDLRGGARRPSWARDEDPADAGFDGPYTVVVVDGDPGGADVREAVVRLAHEGARAGIHVVCLAETSAASPASPVTETYEAACEASPAFRECGAVALLSGDVATALRLMRIAPGGPASSPPREPHGTDRVTPRGPAGADSEGPREPNPWTARAGAPPDSPTASPVTADPHAADRPTVVRRAPAPPTRAPRTPGPQTAVRRTAATPTPASPDTGRAVPWATAPSPRSTPCRSRGPSGSPGPSHPCARTARTARTAHTATGTRACPHPCPPCPACSTSWGSHEPLPLP